MELNLDLTTTPLNKVIHRMALFFVGTFAVACVAVAVYEVVWAIPSKRCAERNGWWDPAQRVCGTPIFLPNFTHRPIGAPKITPLSR
jgi:hypothetical protein